MLALSRLGGSTWGATFTKARYIYNAVIQPALIYGTPIWHRRSADGALKGKEKHLAIYQNQALRNVTGAFKKASIKTIEAEANIPPLSTTLDRLQDQSA